MGCSNSNIKVTNSSPNKEIKTNEIILEVENPFPTDEILSFFSFDNYPELNESNTEIYINNKKYNFIKEINIPSKTKYQFKLKFSQKFKKCNKMFSNLTISIDLSYFDSDDITDLSEMFYLCIKLKKINFKNFNTKNVTTMKGMFIFCESLEELDISNFNTEKVIDMSQMFMGCKNLKRLDLSSVNTKNVITMEKMFSDCISLETINLISFDTQNVTNMFCMFAQCEKLEILDLSNFSFDKLIPYGKHLIVNCESLKNIILNKKNYKKDSFLTDRVISIKFI